MLDLGIEEKIILKWLLLKYKEHYLPYTQPHSYL